MHDSVWSGRSHAASRDAQIPGVQQSLAEDRQKPCKEVTEDVSISQSSVHRVLSDKLDKKKMFSKWVPHLLKQSKKIGGSASQYNSFRNSRENKTYFILRTELSLEMKGGFTHGIQRQIRHSAEWRDRHRPQPEKEHRKQDSLKITYTVFSDTSGIILAMACSYRHHSQCSVEQSTKCLNKY
ncbi:histone-lysine N-methyltransferase SETMAR-like protein [Plakobranchus ocellatus]|uniref:Histone-lysine N-methyltransferase SETMAR-like protein n=1 Tax=Plakobranchus ocellatus TaxID=259542 RepID=A0AAV4B5Q2_9GAST|nr:histone-lysine N-methyltransferase SETMAR-like protein [Plakobranchus ocellatus]